MYISHILYYIQLTSTPELSIKDTTILRNCLHYVLLLQVVSYINIFIVKTTIHKSSVRKG